MSAITANDLKTQGISVLEQGVAERGEAIITVRGKPRFVVLHIEEYGRLRELELDAAIAQTRAELSQGKIVSRDIDSHLRELSK
jgi:prevent-host-death family protein